MLIHIRLAFYFHNTWRLLWLFENPSGWSLSFEMCEGQSEDIHIENLQCHFLQSKGIRTHFIKESLAVFHYKTQHCKFSSHYYCTGWHHLYILTVAAICDLEGRITYGFSIAIVLIIDARSIVASEPDTEWPSISLSSLPSLSPSSSWWSRL